MARIFTEGFEHGTVGTFSGGSAITSNPTPRSGQYAFYDGWQTRYTHFPERNEVYLRVGVNLRTEGGRAIELRAPSDAQIGRVDFNGGIMRLYVGGTLVGSSTCRHYEWFLLEWHLKVADSSGVSQVRVDGQMKIDYTGDTKPGADQTVNKLVIASSIAADDIAINDTAESENNSWCGDGRILPLIPSGDHSVQWSRSGGNANYEMVDERPPDGDSTFVYTATAGAIDKYVVSGTLPNGTVRGVIVYAQAKALTGEALKLRLGVDSNGSEAWSSLISLPTSYAIVNSGLITKDPATGGSWTIQAVQNSRAAIKAES